MKLKKSALYLLFSLLAIISACNNKTDSVKVDAVSSEPARSEMDSLITWFTSDENFNKDFYLKRFYSEFNLLLKKEDLANAEELIYEVGRSFTVNRKSDSTFIKTNLDFLEQYEDSICDGHKSGIMVNLGILYYYLEDFKSSNYYHYKTIESQSKDHFTIENKSLAYNELSYGYLDEGKYDKSLEMAFKALESYDSILDTLGVGNAYHAIGCIYSKLGDVANAEINHQKSVSILTSIDSYESVFLNYLSLLDLYAQNEDDKLDSLIDLAFELQQDKGLDLDYYEIYAKGWKALSLLKHGDYDKAHELIYSVKPKFDKLDETFFHETYIEAATLLDKLTGSNTISPKVYQDAIPKYIKNNDLPGLSTCYFALKNQALDKKDYKNAFLYGEKLQEVEDSLSNMKLILKTKELDKQYKIVAKDQEIIKQKNQINQKNIYMGLLIAGLTSMVVGFLVYYSLQKRNSLKKVELSNQLFTKQLIENTEAERKRIAADLHDSVSHDLLNLKNLMNQDLNDSKTKIDAIINNVRGISRNLHPAMFDKVGLLASIEQLVEQFQNTNDFFISTDINYTGSLKTDDELHIYRIIQEAITNIIKHSRAHAAKIRMAKNGNGYILEIVDNGTGFNVQEVLSEGRSFGLNNIIERAKAIGGKAIMKSSNEGTKITILI
ncbi:Histidine kinase [Spirosomataceae bacterium TFI 002]|nr:Histidine kinase [Spirosomataceae bacterium TFI 002]